jgi:hypothetical protein
MKKLAKTLCLIILLQSFAGCEEKWDMLELSHAQLYLSLLEKLKCKNVDVSIKDSRWEETGERPWRASIVGDWELLLDFSAGDTIDRSCSAVTWSFGADGRVTVKSNVTEIPEGIFEYEYRSDPYCPLCDPGPTIPPNLVIGENPRFCQVSGSWLTTFFCLEKDGYNFRGNIREIFHKIK